ncbi:hypothetical protein [Blastococcus sp. CCUG 61487]|uniref:hypothetical protein n=1 Tax=Blastococcus sp. CCUG 61487 TaxID=1840703 RepID=UPI0010C116B0|nr:hypothetical protein [Blastococcus sp. CCUG 61487]TKJ24334.1 hypothetical protein A6V29_04875 [Blastococcus sp. CCUG 61487]
MGGQIDAPTWRGDPALLVYAVRYALTRQASGSPAPLVVLRALQANRNDLPATAQQAIARDVGAWLDGPGAEQAPADRGPWIMALATLGVRRRRAPVVA